MKRPETKGFSLIELMITLSIAAILLVVAAPSFRDALRRNKVSSASNALLADISYARSEAINRGNVVSICPSSNQATCSNGQAYENGWLVYTYQAGKGVANTAYSATSGAILLRAANARDGLSIQGLDGVITSFGSQGQVRRPDNKQPKFATCFRPAGATGTGTSTASVPGAQLTVNASGGVSSQSLGVQGTCVPS